MYFSLITYVYRRTYTDVSQQMTMLSLPLGHLKNTPNLMSAFLTPIATKLVLGYLTNSSDFVYNLLDHPIDTLGKNVDQQHAIVIASK